MTNLPALPPTTILHVQAGSTAYGLNTPNSDTDEIAVYIEPATEVFRVDNHTTKTVSQRTQPEGAPSGPGDIDRIVYPLRKFIQLAVAGNPSVLPALWSPVIATTDQGIALCNLAPSFTGRHIIPKFRGYMRNLAHQIMFEPFGDSAEQACRRIAAGEAKLAMNAARLGYTCIEIVRWGGQRRPLVPLPETEWLRAVRNQEIEYGEWWDRIHGLDMVLNKLETDTGYPAGPNRDAIQTWMIEAHRDNWNRP